MYIKPLRPNFLDPTRAAEEWRNWVAGWKWDRFVTLTFNQPGNGQPISSMADSRVLALKETLKEWDGRMQRKVVGSNWAAVHDHRMFCIYTLEKPAVNPHWHGLVHFYNVDDDERARQGKQFDEWANATWKKLVPSGDVDVKTTYDEKGAIQYIGKSLPDKLNFEYWVPQDEFWRP